MTVERTESDAEKVLVVAARGSSVSTSSPNPKRDASTTEGVASWYLYYAGYSPAFVRAILAQLMINPGGVILDPWNGCGTTTQVIAEMGFRGIGFDINPVPLVVARSRTLDPALKPQVNEEIRLLVASALSKKTPRQDDDPLTAWFAPESAAVFRMLEKRVRNGWPEAAPHQSFPPRHLLPRTPAITAFLYTALFRTIRRLLSSFSSSNPTWIKQPATLANRLRPSGNAIIQQFAQEARAMAEAIPAVTESPIGAIQLDLASSDAIPLPNNSVDCVIASPPYCTRIDYVVSTLPELSILGYNLNTEIRALRDQMIGTPTIGSGPVDSDVSWGPTCLAFLDSVQSHRSKAAKSYYLKTFLQYFAKLHRSLREIARTVRTKSPIILVVQDSFFKDVHNDLPLILAEMGQSLGWTLSARQDHRLRHTMAAIHPHSKNYRTSTSATESVLHFQA